MIWKIFVIKRMFVLNSMYEGGGLISSYSTDINKTSYKLFKLPFSKARIDRQLHTTLILSEEICAIHMINLLVATDAF